MLGEEDVGDGAIGRARLAGVDDAKHLAGALLPLRAYSRVGRHSATDGSGPEASDCCQAIRCLLVQRNSDRQRPRPRLSGERDVKSFAAKGQPELDFVRRQCCVRREIACRELRTAVARQTWDEDERGGIELRDPEDRLHKRCGVRIGGENATPSAARMRSPFQE